MHTSKASPTLQSRDWKHDRTEKRSLLSCQFFTFFSVKSKEDLISDVQFEEGRDRDNMGINLFELRNFKEAIFV